jgi:hypothetical protein
VHIRSPSRFWFAMTAQRALWTSAGKRVGWRRSKSKDSGRLFHEGFAITTMALSMLGSVLRDERALLAERFLEDDSPKGEIDSRLPDLGAFRHTVLPKALRDPFHD